MKNIHEFIKYLREEINSDCHELLSMYPISKFIDLLDAVPKEAQYNYIPDSLSNFW